MSESSNQSNDTLMVCGYEREKVAALDRAFAKVLIMFYYKGTAVQCNCTTPLAQDAYFSQIDGFTDNVVTEILDLSRVISPNFAQRSAEQLEELLPLIVAKTAQPQQVVQFQINVLLLSKLGLLPQTETDGMLYIGVERLAQKRPQESDSESRTHLSVAPTQNQPAAPAVPEQGERGEKK